jgi:hypothetical protein
MLTYDNTIDYDREANDNGIFVFFPENSSRAATKFIAQTEPRMDHTQRYNAIRSWSVDGGFNIPAIWKS